MARDLRAYSGGVVVTDGAWGTQLAQRGLPAGSAPELWNIEAPEAVEAVAAGYVAAGSDVILTNTFGANAFALARHGAADRAAELAEAGVAISRRAAGEKAKVFASLGPTGKIVMMGEVPEEDVYVAFAEVAVAFARGGADAVVIETMTEVAEAALAARAVLETTDLPVVASLTFGSGPARATTVMGDTPGEAVAALAPLGVSAFGANCGVGPDSCVEVVRQYRWATEAPIWVKANAGLPEVVDGETRFPLGPEPFAAFVAALAEAGANFIGGCCGTTPEHIVAVRRAVDAL